ncbi:GNAT family N-acetyltransferase [Streptomyces sp. NPDC007088]|uniref:GNAT family N-acetyltransferase n=1 Tax=Streptomyces sp. NPDC007088 TaxID=3364773 RepID=UPI0036B2A3FF
MDFPARTIALDDLTLRAFDIATDLAELYRVTAQSLDHLRPWVPWVPETYSLVWTADYLAARCQRWREGTEFTYAVVLDGALAGACGLYRHEDTPARCHEIGYWLHPAATGRGVATRAAWALTEEAFRLPGVELVEIVHDPANLPSGAVPARLGFSRHRRRPAERLAPAETGEELVWRLTRREALDRIRTGRTPDRAPRGPVREG